MQGPTFGRQRQGLPQVVRRAVGSIDPGQPTVIVKAPQRLVVQWLQRLLVVLAGGLEFGTVAVAQGLQMAIAPARPVGDEHDAPGVADQQGVAALAPFTFKLRKFQLHYHCAEEFAVVTGYRAGQEITRNAAGHTHRVETPGALGAGLEEVGPEAIVVADVTAGQAPVAGRHGQAGTVEQFQGRGLRGVVDFFQFAIQRVLLRRTDRSRQGRTQLRVQRQYGG